MVRRTASSRLPDLSSRLPDLACFRCLCDRSGGSGVTPVGHRDRRHRPSKTMLRETRASLNTGQKRSEVPYGALRTST